MSKQSIDKLFQKIADNEISKKAIEEKIKNNQMILEKIEKELETDINLLKNLQNIENKLRHEIREQHKKDLNENLNIESIRKTLSKAKPLFSKIKNSTIDKANDVKNYINSNSDRKWLEQKYNEYKIIALKKGEDIKSKDEFKKIILSIKSVQSEIQELNLYDIINKLSNDAGHASKTIKNVIKNIKIEEKIETIVNKKSSEDSVKKFAIFKEWASHKSVNLNEPSDDLYNNYLEYLSKKYSNLDIKNISYSKKSGSFTKALNKYNNPTE